MKRKVAVSIICLFLFPLTVNSHTTIGKVEFYNEESIFEENKAPETVEKEQMIEKETNDSSNKNLGQLGPKVESSLIIVGLMLIGIALYYFDKNRRMLK